jgi:hypothetical protein
MTNLLQNLIHDDAGFVVSAELILVSTIVVLSLVVGLSEVASAINQELEDVGSAFGSINQSFAFNGYSGCKAHFKGSFFSDNQDECDDWCDITCSRPPQGEGQGGHDDDNGHGGYGGRGY